MGDGRIFLKTRRDTSFNKDLLNEPNFDRIHLALSDDRKKSKTTDETYATCSYKTRAKLN
jgi:hypothetical protein